MTSRPTIGQAVVTDPGEGRASGYALVAASPDVRPVEAQHLQAAPQVTDHLHLEASPGPYFSFYRLPGGRFALARRFVRGTRRGAFNRVVAHTLLVPRETLAAVSDEPWLFTTRCRFRDRSAGRELTPAELAERAAAAGLDALPGLECLPPADPRGERYALLARRRELLRKRWDDGRLETLLGAVFAILAAGRRVLLAQDAASEQLLAFAWSALPAADRLETPWTTHLATAAAALFRLANVPDPEAARRELADPEDWALPEGGAMAAGGADALARAVAGDGERWPELYAGLRRHGLRLADGDAVERWVAWRRRGEPRLAGGFDRVEELAEALASFRLGPDGEVSEPWIHRPLILACAASTALRNVASGSDVDAALAAVGRVLEETRWHRALLAPEVVGELPRDLRPEAPAVAAILALARLPAVPEGLAEREAYLEPLLAAPVPGGALGRRIRRELAGVAADLAADASFHRLSDSDFLRWGAVTRRLADAVAADEPATASRLRSSWWRQLAARTWDRISPASLAMLDDLAPGDRRAVAEAWLPRVAQLDGERGAGDLELLSRLRDLAAEDPELAFDYHLGRLVAGLRSGRLELDQAVARAAAVAGDAPRTSAYRRSLFRALRRLLPAAPADRAREVVGLLLSPRLLPSTKRFLETELLEPTFDAAGPGFAGGLPSPERLAERGNLLLRIAARRGRHWRADPEAAAGFLHRLARLERYDAATAFLHAAEPPSDDKAAARSFLALLAAGADPELLGRLRRAATVPPHRHELHPFAAKMRRLAESAG